MRVAIGKILETGASASALILLLCLPLNAQSILFPTPIHLTREVYDPVTDSSSVVDEYYHGNRVVSIRGDSTSIADYEKGELIEIHRGRGTWSVSRFDQIARALDSGTTGGTETRKPETLETRSVGEKRQAGRVADLVEVSTRDPRPATRDSLTATVAFDREIVLSRDAFEVMTGAAYPHRAKPEQHMVAAAAAASAIQKSSQEGYRLPLEQSFTHRLDGETLQFRSAVIAVSRELPPPDLLRVPPGARRVEGAWVERARMLEQLER